MQQVDNKRANAEKSVKKMCTLEFNLSVASKFAKRDFA